MSEPATENIMLGETKADNAKSDSNRQGNIENIDFTL